jgi:hypothetical protein
LVKPILKRVLKTHLLNRITGGKNGEATVCEQPILVPGV